MKIFFTFFTLLGIIGQMDGQEILRKCNRIIIFNEKSAQQNYIHAKSIIADNGIEIKTQDADILQITTGIIPGKGNSESHYIIQCKDSLISIRGLFKSNLKINIFGQTGEGATEQISNMGMPGSVYQKVFNAMNTFALKMGSTVKYERLN